MLRRKRLHLWHSGMLFLLALLLTLDAAAALRVSLAGGVERLAEGAEISPSRVSELVCECDDDAELSSDTDELQRAGCKTTVWKVDGKTIDLSNEPLRDHQQLECLSDNGASVHLRIIASDQQQQEGMREQQPELSVELSAAQGDEELVEGGQLDLRCSVRGVQQSHSEPVVAWLKDGQLILMDEAANSDSLSVQEASSGEEATLTIKPLAPEDKGSYSCSASLQRPDGDALRASSQPVAISVSYGPIFVEAPTPEQEVSFGRGFQLRCEARALPEATIKWTINGKALSDIPEGLIELDKASGSLSVLRATQDTSGDFECEATNTIATKTAKAAVKLIYQAPGEVSVSPPDRDLLLLEGSSSGINCSAEGVPLPTIAWTLLGEQAPRSQQTGSSVLLLKDLTVHQDGQTFTCEATNPFGSSHALVKVSVAEKTQILTRADAGGRSDLQAVDAHLGELLKLNCSFSKDRRLEANVQWTKNGVPIHGENSHELKLSNVSSSDEGSYKCTVSTSLDSVSRTFVVSVVQVPHIEPFSPPDKRYVLRGENVTIPCVAKGIPEPQVAWTGPQEVEGHVLSLRNVQDQAKYACRASNDFGSVEQSLSIVTVAPTTLLQENRTVLSLRAGTRLILNCSVALDPLLAMTSRRAWIKDGVLLQTSLGKERLEVPYLREDSAGNYLCRVTTEVDDLILAQTVSVVSAAPKIKRNGNTSERKFAVLSGQNTTLDCQVEGIPPPQVTWMFGSETIPGASSNTLELSQVTSEEHQGTYTCLAANEYGRDQVSFNLDVLDKTVFSRAPKDILLKSLERAVFRCEVESDPRIKSQVSVEWLKNDSSPVQDSYVHSDGSLVIPKTLKADEGTYTCVVRTPYETINKTSRLTVLGERPSFIATEKDVRVLEGTKVTISCQANGLPLPAITWRRKDPNGEHALIQGLSGRHKQLFLGDLEISEVSLPDQGEYICAAENVYGLVETVTSLQVIRRAAPSTGAYTREITRNMRGNATLDCDVSYDERLSAETEVSWSKDGSLLDLASSKYELLNDGHSLFLDDLSLKDKGIYECRVKTPFETIGSTVALRVSGEAPQILSNLKKMTLYEGDDINLKCLVRGTPTPSLMWLFNDVPLEGAMVQQVPTASKEFVESHVVLKSASKAHEGVYQCETSNKYGSGVAKFAKVSVVRRTAVAITSDQDKSLSVRAGQRLLLPCKVENDPLNRITNIQWTKDGSPIHIGPKDRIDFGMDGSLTVSDIQRRHEGEYRCTASTVLDNATDVVSVSVIVNAPVITSHSKDQVLFSGDDITLSCSANGIPSPSMRWTFNKTKTGVKASDYHVENAIASDAGSYVCTAKNDYGETKQTMQLAVIAVPTLQAEYQVKEGGRLQLPCVAQAKNVNVVWMKDGKALEDIRPANVEITKDKGLLLFRNITADTPGVYSYMATSSSGRRKTLQTVVKLKPNLITAEPSSVAVREGDKLKLSCSVLPGIDTKRLWKHRGQFFIEGGSRDIKERGGSLIIDPISKDDAGTFACVAIASFGQDVVEHEVQVLPQLPKTASNVSITDGCGPQSTTAFTALAPIVTSVRPLLDELSAEVRWVLPMGLNHSCFEAVSVSWWSNASDSQFTEKRFSLSEESAVIHSLSPQLGYYLQVNLVAPLNVFHYGETRSFNLNEDFLDFSLSPSLEAAEANEGYLPVAVLVGVLLVVFILVVLMVILYLKRKWIADRLKGTRRSKMSEEEAAMRRKRHLNGAAISMYDGRIHISQPYAVTTGPYSSGVNGSEDFMQSLVPQWPEPDPEPSCSTGTETDAFLPHGPNTSSSGATSCSGSSASSSQALPLQQLGSGGLRGPSAGSIREDRRHSKASIGSSWSSLFNQLNPDCSGGSVRSSTISTGNHSGHAANNRVSFAGIGSGRSYRTRPSHMEA